MEDEVQSFSVQHIYNFYKIFFIKVIDVLDGKRLYFVLKWNTSGRIKLSHQGRPACNYQAPKNSFLIFFFSGLRPPQGSATERDHKKFILYSVYAWGTSGTLSVITATVEFVPGLAVGSPFKPNFGRRACWFEGELVSCILTIW